MRSTKITRYYCDLRRHTKGGVVTRRQMYPKVPETFECKLCRFLSKEPINKIQRYFWPWFCPILPDSQLKLVFKIIPMNEFSSRQPDDTCMFDFCFPQISSRFDYKDLEIFQSYLLLKINNFVGFPSSLSTLDSQQNQGRVCPSNEFEFVSTNMGQDVWVPIKIKNSLGTRENSSSYIGTLSL